MKVQDLKPNYHIYGNKGNVWNNTAHIYKDGVGTLCGTPALSHNWAKEENVQEIGCPKCLEKYQSEERIYSRADLIRACLKMQHDYPKFCSDSHFPPNMREIAEWTDNWIDENL